jgi:superfamily I DNA/RNA helicase
LSTPDYVGGLEFSAVILVGVDKGRVPPREFMASPGSGAFLSYQAHSRLYVAITRARYRVEILGSAERGPSDLLKTALECGAIEKTGA